MYRFIKSWLVAAIIGVALSPAYANVTARSWLVTSQDGQTIASQNPDEVRSIASITKLLTVLTVLDAHQDLTEQISLSRKIPDRLPAKVSTLSRRQLIELALVNSDNRAAQTLCEHYPGGFEACIAAMNHKLGSLGMQHSRVFEPTGLDARNVSTAAELVRLVTAASHYPIVREDSSKTKVEIKVRKKFFVFRQTNSLVGKKQKILVTKTGWTQAAGGCLAMLLDTDLGQRVVIVMGSRSTHTRINEAEFIANLSADQ